MPVWQSNLLILVMLGFTLARLQAADTISQAQRPSLSVLKVGFWITHPDFEPEESKAELPELRYTRKECTCRREIYLSIAYLHTHNLF